MDLRAFRIPCQRLCVSYGRRHRPGQRGRAEDQGLSSRSTGTSSISPPWSIEIRNPNSVIIGVAEGLDGKASRCILTQAERIESIINRLDEQWIASENIRHFLRRTITTPPFL